MDKLPLFIYAVFKMTHYSGLLNDVKLEKAAKNKKSVALQKVWTSKCVTLSLAEYCTIFVVFCYLEMSESSHIPYLDTTCSVSLGSLIMIEAGLCGGLLCVCVCNAAT